MDHNKLHAVTLMAIGNQDELNKSLHPEWYNQEYPYYRAVWTELAEAIQHSNWLWWKAADYGKPDSPEQIADIHIELCDIFHFGMSMDIITSRKTNDLAAALDYTAREYMRWFQFDHLRTDFYEDLEQIVMTAISTKTFDIEHFSRACLAVGLTFPRLLVMYFGKATLNKFRWENGYKLPKDDPKKYKKMWPALDGSTGLVEDNVHLSYIVNRLLTTNPEAALVDAIFTGEFQKMVYDRLRLRYEMV